MADRERIKLIMGKLRAKTGLTEDELSELQTHVDQLETPGRAGVTFHHTSSSPHSHFSHHDTAVTLGAAGILEQVTPSEQGTPRK